MRLDIQYDDGEVLDALDRIVKAGGNLAPVMASIGESLLNSTRQRFADEEAPAGDDWAQLSDHTKKRKRRHKDRILTEFGYLRGQLNVRASADAVMIGSSMVQASTMHFGAEAGGTIPAPAGKPLAIGPLDGQFHSATMPPGVRPPARGPHGARTRGDTPRCGSSQSPSLR